MKRWPSTQVPLRLSRSHKNMQDIAGRIGLLFMSGEKDLIKKFKISIVETVPPEKKGKKPGFVKKNISSPVSGEKVTFEFLPEKRDSFVKAILVIDVEKLLISRVTVFDLARNKTVVKLKNIKFNTGTDDSFFEFKPPDDIEVYGGNS